jgi:outer membrane immunogenic protein
MKRALLVSLSLLCGTTSAWAADMVTEVEPAPPEATVETVTTGWDGGYIGVQGGASWLRGHYDFGAITSNHHSSGGRLGGFAGWNAQLDNNIVLGIEGDFTYDWNKEKVNGYDVGTDWSGAVRGRVGYAMDNVLLYGAAGWTATRAFVDPPTLDRGKKTLHGYTVGVGADYKFNENMFARAEYRFNDYGSKEIRGVEVNPTQHAFIVGIGYKF